MTKPYKKIVASNGAYMKDGVEKKRWQNVGTLFQDDEGRLSIKMDCVPVGKEWSGWFNCFELDSKKDVKQGDDEAAPF